MGGCLLWLLVSWVLLLLLALLVALLWLSSYGSRSSCKRTSTEEQRDGKLPWQPLPGIIIVTQDYTADLAVGPG